MNPTLVVLLYASIAAGAAALGVLPLLGRKRVPRAWIGWSNALAAGMMLGAAYMLGVAAHSGPPLTEAVAALLGILFIYWTHAVSGVDDLDLNNLDESDPRYGFQILLVNTLHSGSEGVAIGAAMALDLSFGIFMALAIAVHNIPEATVLSAVVRSRGVPLGGAAGLAVAANVSQVLMAVVVYSVTIAAPAVLPWTVGFAFGALVQLVMIELLPQSYDEAGKTGIAVVTVVTMGIVVLLQGLYLIPGAG